MDQIAEFLIEKETITGKEFMKIFRKCEGIPEPEEKEEGPAKKLEESVKEEIKEEEEKVGNVEEKAEESPAAPRTDENGFILPE